MSPLLRVTVAYKALCNAAGDAGFLTPLIEKTMGEFGANDPPVMVKVNTRLAGTKLAVPAASGGKPTNAAGELSAKETVIPVRVIITLQPAVRAVAGVN